MATLTIGIATVGALLLLLVAIGRKTSRQVENQEEILSKIEQERESLRKLNEHQEACKKIKIPSWVGKDKSEQPQDDCMNPLLYPVCSCCKFVTACESKCKIK